MLLSASEHKTGPLLKIYPFLMWLVKAFNPKDRDYVGFEPGQFQVFLIIILSEPVRFTGLCLLPWLVSCIGALPGSRKQLRLPWGISQSGATPSGL